MLALLANSLVSCGHATRDHYCIHYLRTGLLVRHRSNYTVYIILYNLETTAEYLLLGV